MLAHCSVAYGVDVQWPALYQGRLSDLFVVESLDAFIDNPCERPFPGFEASDEEPVIEAMVAGSLEPALLEATGISRQELQGYSRGDRASSPMSYGPTCAGSRGCLASPPWNFIHLLRRSSKWCRSPSRPGTTPRDWNRSCLTWPRSRPGFRVNRSRLRPGCSTT